MVRILLFLLLSADLYAFDREEIVFESKIDKKPNVLFIFTGKVFEDPINLLSKDDLKDTELREFKNFFHKLYELNKNGSKNDVLLLWNPFERKQMEKEINKVAFQKNKAIFQSITNMYLKMIIEYGDYYICYVENEFNRDKRYVMKFPLIKKENDMYLTNNLNGDYFYDNISHLLDRTNYMTE